MRRLLLFTTDLEIGGTPTVVRELAIRLSKFAHVEVACLKGDGPTGEAIRAAGIQVTAFGVHRPWQIRSATQRLVQLIEGRGIDTVLSFLIHANVVAARASKRRREVRWFQSIQTTQPKPKWHWWVQGRIVRRAEKIIVPSSAIVGVARERSRIAPTRCVVIPNGVDAEAFRVDRIDCPDRFRIGFVGRLDPIKHVDEAIAAVVAMRPMHPNWSLDIFGDGPERARLEALGAGDRQIRFHGEISDPREAYRRMDCLVLPSRGEGFGLVLIEAMAAGVPVIACYTGGVIDIIEQGVDGLMYLPDHGYAGLAFQLEKFHQDWELPHRLRRAGEAKVRTKFSWEKIIGEYVRVLDLA